MRNLLVEHKRNFRDFIKQTRFDSTRSILIDSTCSILLDENKLIGALLVYDGVYERFETLIRVVLVAERHYFTVLSQLASRKKTLG